jgi:chromosome segregation ATPase
MGSLDRFYKQVGDGNYESVSDGKYGSDEGELRTEVIRFPQEPPATAKNTCNAALNLVYQAAEVIKDIEDQASEVQKTAHQKLQVAKKRIEELETDLRAAQVCITDARNKLREAEETARAERSRLDAAEKRMCELEMVARTAEAKAKENASSVARIEEAIRTQLLARRSTPTKPASRT